MNKRSDYRLTAGLLIAHTLILTIGFNILVAVFEFPGILRMPADHRLTVFMAHSNIIVPTYYMLALTGLTQVALAVMLQQVLDKKQHGLLALATTFGVLTGLFQVLGFMRWTILLPFLGSAFQNGANGVSPAMVAFVEEAFNHYVGMTVGEHLGFLAQAIWITLLGVVLLRSELFHGSLAWATLVIGLITFPMGLEPLGGLFKPLAFLSAPVNGAWLICLFIMAISLLRTNAETGIGIRLGWRTLALATVVWLAAVVPAFLPK